jgi:hypothetical protein
LTGKARGVSIYLSKKKFFMRSHGKFIVIRSLLVLICAGLFSFSDKKGGDSFEIWLNGKKILQQFVHASNAVQTLQISPASDNDKLIIYYSHCGQVGKDRYITIKDENNRALKVWKFQDAIDKNAAMEFKLKDILSLRKNKAGKLGISYSSHELPEGKMLAIITGDESVVRK